MYRKQILAALAGYRVAKIEDSDGVWRYAVYSPRGLIYRNSPNPGHAWWFAYKMLQLRLEIKGEP